MLALAIIMTPVLVAVDMKRGHILFQLQALLLNQVRRTATQKNMSAVRHAGMEAMMVTVAARVWDIVLIKFAQERSVNKSEMFIKFLSFLLFLIPVFLLSSVSAQNIPMPSGMTCEGSQFADGTYLPRGQVGYVTINGVKYKCVGCGECTPLDSGSPGISSSGLRPEQQVQLMFMQSILQPILNSIFNPQSFAPSRPSQEEIRRQQEELLKKQAQERQDRLNKWIFLRNTSTSGQKERGKKISSLLAVDQPLPAKTDPLEQVLCSAYFSRLAEEAVNGNFDRKRFKDGYEAARFYVNQIDNLIQGLPLDEECNPPDEILQSFDKKEVNELNKNYTEVVRTYNMVMPKISELQGIVLKLDETRKKKQEMEQKIKEIDLNIEELKSTSQNISDPQKKAEADDLLAKAMALKQEAETEYKKSLEMENNLIKEKEKLEKELDKIKEQFTVHNRK